MESIRLFSPEIPAKCQELTVQEVVSAYLASLQIRVAANDFSRDHYLNIRHWLDRFAGQFRQSVSACAQRDLIHFLAANPGWKSAATKRNVCTAVVGCFRWASDEEGGALIDNNPYRRPKSVFELPVQPRRPATHEEYVALMRHGSRPLRRALFFLRRTGARTIEMRELLWINVFLDCENPYVFIVKPKTFRKTGKARKIGLDAATANWLRALRRGAGRNTHVFLNCDGNPWQRRVFSRHLRRTAERIGLDDGAESRVSAYCLRHTYATDAIEAGITTREIADQLGHTTTQMIDRVYGCSTREREGHLGNVQTKIMSKRRRG